MRICIVAGDTLVQEGAQPYSVIKGDEFSQEEMQTIWVLNHQSMDGAGKGASHFTYITEDRDPKTFYCPMKFHTTIN